MIVISVKMKNSQIELRLLLGYAKACLESKYRETMMIKAKKHVNKQFSMIIETSSITKKSGFKEVYDRLTREMHDIITLVVLYLVYHHTGKSIHMLYISLIGWG